MTKSKDGHSSTQDMRYKLYDDRSHIYEHGGEQDAVTNLNTATSDVLSAADGTFVDVKVKHRRKEKRPKMCSDNEVGHSCMPAVFSSPKKPAGKERHKKRKLADSHCGSSFESTDNIVKSKPSTHHSSDVVPAVSTLKKKKKVKHIKDKRKIKNVAAVENTTAHSTSQYHALEYLRTWKSARDSWTFQKVRQVWLLHHMYDHTKVGEDDFSILLEYLEKLVGKAREVTVEAAEKLIQEAEQAEENNGDSHNENDEKYERIRQVLQILS